MGTGKAAGVRFEAFKKGHEKTYEEALKYADDPEKFKTGVDLVKARPRTERQMAASAKVAASLRGRWNKRPGDGGSALPTKKETK
jgi:hypothetical protein